MQRSKVLDKFTAIRKGEVHTGHLIEIAEITGLSPTGVERLATSGETSKKGWRIFYENTKNQKWTNLKSPYYELAGAIIKAQIDDYNDGLTDDISFFFTDYFEILSLGLTSYEKLCSDGIIKRRKQKIRFNYKKFDDYICENYNSLEEASREIGLTSNTIRNYMKRNYKPNENSINIISLALKLPRDYFIIKEEE